MGRTSSMVKPGLSLAQHRQLGADLRQIRGHVLDLRGVLKEAIGSATNTYMEATKVVRTLERLQTALLFEATGEHADQVALQELRALYANEEGA
jgi:hypothetical protein